jgi:hypothetical protein
LCWSIAIRGSGLPALRFDRCAASVSRMCSHTVLMLCFVPSRKWLKTDYMGWHNSQLIKPTSTCWLPTYFVFPNTVERLITDTAGEFNFCPL